jgi:catechol 2,3-dioxygenase-like lactoylglutathione lyase family enzyme
MVGKDGGRLLEPRSIFKATAFNHISYGVSDIPRTRDWLMDLFGMTCVYDDGIRCSVDFGSPPNAFYVVKSRMPDGSAHVDHMAISIADFDLKGSEETLKKYGLEPEYDGDFAWTILDPFGYRVQVCAEHGVFPGAAIPGAVEKDEHHPTGTARSRPGVFQATAVNHVAYQVPDYAKSRDWFMDLFGMRLAFEDGLKCSVAFGDPENALYITPNRRPEGGARVDHLAISVSDFDLEEAREKLEKFGLDPEPDGDSAWTVLDPDGYRIQVCGEVGVYPGAAQDFFHQLSKKK